MFSDMGRAIINEDDDINKLLYLLGILNSNVFSEIIKLKGMSIYEGGVINNCPIPDENINKEWSQKIIELTKKVIKISFLFSCDSETSNYFRGPLLMRHMCTDLDKTYKNYLSTYGDYLREYNQVKFDIDNLSRKLYNVTINDDVEELLQIKELNV